MSSKISVNTSEDKGIRPVRHQLMTLQVMWTLHFTVPNVIISWLVYNDVLHPYDMQLYIKWIVYRFRTRFCLF